MSVLRLLMGQHDRVEGLLVDLTQAGDKGPEAKKRALEELSRELKKHLDLEESHFYAHISSRLILVRADRFLDEHQRLRDLLAVIEAAPDAPEYTARLEDLHDLLVQHVSDEEIELFPEVKRRFSVDELDEMGERIEQLSGVQPAEPAAEGPGLSES